MLGVRVREDIEGRTIKIVDLGASDPSAAADEIELNDDEDEEWIMTALAAASFDALARHTATPCVSIILPIDRHHADDRRVHLELKSLLASARAQLTAMDAPGIDDLLEPFETVLQRTVIAEHSGGLALFVAPGFAAEFAVDVPVQALATTGNQFTIGPLLSSVENGPTCYVLTVGAENVALLRLDRTQWSVCEVSDLPASVDEALWSDGDERMSGSHSGGPIGGGGNSTMSHGGLSLISHGSGGQDEDRKEHLDRFFQKVDKAVLQFLHSDVETPLVVAGTAPTVARYQHITRHRRVIAAPVGSPEELTTHELHQRVKELIEPVLTEGDDVLFERLATRLGTELASADLDELMGATAEGRVSDLFVASTTPRWGGPTQPDGYLDQWEPGATDFVNGVISEAWRHGARMHRVSPERLPEGSPLAALYRY